VHLTEAAGDIAVAAGADQAEAATEEAVDAGAVVQVVDKTK